MKMKMASILLFTAVPVVGQVADKAKTIAFDRADAEHCHVVMIEGRPMLQTSYGGTSVAVGLPVSVGSQDFRIFVVVQQAGPGRAQVKPKEFSALYSDPAHTRFGYYDKAAEVAPRRESPEQREPEIITASLQADPGTQGLPPTPGPEADIDRQARSKRISAEDPTGATRDQEQAREEQQRKSAPGSVVTARELYLHRCTLRRGHSAEGFVYFRKPKSSKLTIGAGDLLFEVDIRVNGIIFRFS